MSPTSRLRTRSSSPPTIPPNSPVLITQMRSLDPITASRCSMSIPNLLATIRASSLITSIEDADATKASQVPPSESTTTPTDDVAMAVSGLELLTAGTQLCSMWTRNESNDDDEIVMASIEEETISAAPIDGSTATRKDKGKGKDPILYNVDPQKDGKDPDQTAAIPLLQLSNKPVLDAAYILQSLSNRPCAIGMACCHREWHQCAYHRCPFFSSSVSPSPEEAEDDSDDEGLPLHRTPKIGFSTSCFGIRLEHSAHEGNAIFDILSHPPSLPRNQYRLRHSIELPNGEEAEPSPRTVSQERAQSIHARYEEGYGKLGCEQFEREDTLPLSQDAVDEEGAVYDEDMYDSAMATRFPKLGLTWFGNLIAERWTRDPGLFLPENDREDSTRPPVHAGKSSPPVSNNDGASTGPAAGASQPANDTPVPSQKGPSYFDERTGTWYYPAADPIPDPLTNTTAALKPSVRKQKKQTKPMSPSPMIPSPLRQVQTLAPSDQTPQPSEHNSRKITTRDNPVPSPPPQDSFSRLLSNGRKVSNSNSNSNNNTKPTNPPFPYRPRPEQAFVYKPKQELRQSKGGRRTASSSGGGGGAAAAPAAASAVGAAAAPAVAAPLIMARKRKSATLHGDADAEVEGETRRCRRRKSGGRM